MSQTNLIDIIIPTWNNAQYLQPALQSILRNKTAENLFHIYVVNNGHPDSCDWINHPDVTVIQAGDNLRWEGGINLGLKHTKAPFVMFLNDDIHIPQTSRNWLNQMLQHFKDSKVAAVGPSSNVVMGFQNIFGDVPYEVFRTRFLIGFCVLLRRSALDEIGHIDEELPGGDDFDWSIRFRKAGYHLLIDRSVFVYHHGFKTGIRLHGDHTQTNGWNSYEFKEKVDHALIRKHGFREWAHTIKGAYEFDFKPKENDQPAWEDAEGEKIRPLIKGKKILDLGCGGNKTVPEAIGVDMIPYDEVIDTLSAGTKSSADVNADVSKPLPFKEATVDTIICRHILEHLTDPIEAITNWKRALKVGGRLIIAVPDESRYPTIPMNIEHKHAYTPAFLKTLLEKCGFKVVKQLDPQNHISFITVATKI